ncbi:MAG TPA: hypothetical protein VIT67_04245 [Povalibacter sp.]
MFNIQMSRDSIRNAVCMLLSVVIVAASLTCGAIGVQSMESRASEPLPVVA